MKKGDWVMYRHPDSPIVEDGVIEDVDEEGTALVKFANRTAIIEVELLELWKM